MNDIEFKSFLNQLGQHLNASKRFVENPFRAREMTDAFNLACKLFPDAKVTIQDDPLQMGAVFLCVEDCDMDVCGEESIAHFSAMFSKANDVEIYATDNGNVRISVLFNDVFVVIK